MNQWVEITFDCLPLRTISRLDIPIDASPRYVQWCERVKAAINIHGTHNAYYLYNAHCKYHLLNSDAEGEINFRFEGTVLTDEQDLKCRDCHVEVKLTGETCDWLTEPVKDWFQASVPKAVAVEFNRYIAAGDLQKTRDRIEKIQAESDDAGGFVGMYL
jgi:hypothetical protein